MAYTIYNNDGTVLLTLAEGEVDTLTTSLTLIGKNVNNYGEYFNNNLVKLLTSFSSPAGSSPISPLPGQLWFNSTDKKLFVYDGITYQSLFGASVSGTRPLSTSTGELWFNNVDNQLFVWNGSTFKLIGPANKESDGKTGIFTSTDVLENVTNRIKQVGVIYSYGRTAGLISTASFTMSTASSVTYLNTNTATSLVAGLTIFKDLDVKGNQIVQGNLTVSGNVSFDGLTVDSSTVDTLTVNNLDVDIAGNIQTLTANDGYFSTLQTNGSSRFIGILRSDNQGIFNTIKVSPGNIFAPITNSSNLAVDGSVAFKTPVTVSAPTYAVQSTDFSLRFDTASCVLTLPTASAFPGRVLSLSNVVASTVSSNASNVVLLGTSTAQTSILTNVAGKFSMIQSDGTNWITIMAN